MRPLAGEIHAHSRLSGRRLAAARAAWAVLTGLSLAAFGLAAPARYAHYLSPAEEVRDGLTQLGYSAQYIQQYGTEAAARAALAPLGLSPAGYAGLSLTLEGLVALVYITVGLVVAGRKSEDGFGLFASLFLIAFGVGGSSYWLLALVVGSPAGFVFGGLVTTLAYALMPAFFFLFPDGRWVPRWGWLPTGLWTVTTVLWNLAPRSPLNPTNWPAWLYALTLTFIWGAAALAQIYRYRRVSSPAQRQQSKWLVAGFGLLVLLLLLPSIALALIPSSFFTETLFALLMPLQVVLLGVIPVTLGISILRYRLWDIDVIIRRTLVYSALTALLALTYWGLVIMLQGVVGALGGARSEWITVASTLAVAGLVLPLRKRVQAFIDRRFFRRKYDAQQVLADFAAAARDETDLNALTDRLAGVVQATMEPESVTLWLKENPS